MRQAMKQLISMFLVIAMLLCMPGLCQKREAGQIKAADKVLATADFTGENFQGYNMEYVANINMETENVQFVTKDGVNGLHSDPGKYVYYRVTNGAVTEDDSRLLVNITYYDEGNEGFVMQYNAAGGENNTYYYKGTVAATNNTKKWVTTTIILNDASFRKKQNNGCDFRFITNQSAGLTISNISITKESEDIGDENDGTNVSSTISEKLLLLHGRTYYENNALTLAWSNSGCTFNFTGTGATAKISTSTIHELIKGYINVYVDDALVPTKTIRLDGSYGTYVLAEGLTDEQHTITIRKRNEAAYGGNATISISKISITDGYFMAPPEPSKKKIEFVGDSITSGFGNLVQDGSGDYSTATMEGTMSYAALTGKAFDADTSIISRSGIRFVRTDSGESMIDYYPQVSGLTGNKAEWNFGSGSDVVVINLGTNDNGATNNGVSVTDQYIQSEAVELLKLVRGKNPHAVIIWAYGIMGDGRSNAIKAAVASMNDSNIYYLPLDVRNEATEGLGIGGHPTVTTDINRSFDVVEFIADKAGWDYNYDSQLATELWLLREYDNEALKKYTHESASHFVAVRKKAKALQKDSSVEKVKAAVTDLQIAKNALVIGDGSNNYNPGAEEPDLTEFKFKTVSLNLQNNLSMIFKVSKNTLEGFSNAYVEFQWDNETIKNSDCITSTADYGFIFDDIPPYMMNDTVTAVLHATYDANGKEYTSAPLKYSVKKYAYTALGYYSNDQKLRTLVVDMLNYGAADQKYENYRTNELVNADLTATQKTYASTLPELKNITDKAYKIVSNPSVTWNNIALSLDKAVMMRFRFTASSTSGLTAKVVCGDRTFTYAEKDFQSNGDGTYSLYCRDLYAVDMRVPVTITMYKGTTVVSNTMLSSIESYAKAVQGSSLAGTALNDVTDAMMKYGISAEKYGI